jgi:hypothetical protein
MDFKIAYNIFNGTYKGRVTLGRYVEKDTILFCGSCNNAFNIGKT